MTDRHVDPDFGAAGVVHGIQRRFHVQACLRRRGRDARDPNDDRGEEDDRDAEDQDRADDLGNAGFIFAQDGFHGGGPPGGLRDYGLAPDPTLYKLFAVVTTTTKSDSHSRRESERNGAPKKPTF